MLDKGGRDFVLQVYYGGISPAGLPTSSSTKTFSGGARPLLTLDALLVCIRLLIPSVNLPLPQCYTIHCTILDCGQNSTFDTKLTKLPQLRRILLLN